MKRGFTLIELLAVMAIMAIAIGIAVAGIHASKAAEAGTAARTMHATLNLARQWAITKRTTVAVLVIPKGFQETYVALPAGMRDGEARMYAVFDVKHRRYLQSWKMLPGNTVFDWTQTKPEEALFRVAGVPFPGTENASAAEQRELDGVVFTCRGMLLEPRPVVFRITDGHTEAEGARWVPKIRPNGQQWRVEVSYPGRVRVEG